MVGLHVVDTDRDLAQEALRRRDLLRFAHDHDLQGLARVVQAFGTVQFTATVAVLVALGLAGRRRWSRVVAVLLVTYVVVYAVAVTKLLLLHPPAMRVFGNEVGSFPSGHTADVTAIAGVLLVALVPLRWRLVPYAVAIGGGIVVGGTRVISGAHTPDDVLAGWLLGSSLVLAAGAWLASRET